MARRFPLTGLEERRETFRIATTSVPPVGLARGIEDRDTFTIGCVVR
jgi:hypothetical protein